MARAPRRLDAALLRDFAAAAERGGDPWTGFDRAMLALAPHATATRRAATNSRAAAARCGSRARSARTVAAQLALFAVVLGDLFLHRTW